jgi:hypothetical protein
MSAYFLKIEYFHVLMLVGQYLSNTAFFLPKIAGYTLPNSLLLCSPEQKAEIKMNNELSHTPFLTYHLTIFINLNDIFFETLCVNLEIKKSQMKEPLILHYLPF